MPWGHAQRAPVFVCQSRITLRKGKNLSLTIPLVQLIKLPARNLFSCKHKARLLSERLSQLCGVPRPWKAYVSAVLQLCKACHSSLRSRFKQSASDSIDIHVKGLTSKFAVGCGRLNTDRQFFYINGRPCNLPKVGNTISCLLPLSSTARSKKLSTKCIEPSTRIRPRFWSPISLSLLVCCHHLLPLSHPTHPLQTRVMSTSAPIRGQFSFTTRIV
jgi:hypothetical protein